MGKREITILDTAATSIANIAFYIESQGLPVTAKRFVDGTFKFFESLSDQRVVHRLCSYKKWTFLNYRCATFKKKYVVAYLSHTTEIVICDFVPYKLLEDK